MNLMEEYGKIRVGLTGGIGSGKSYVSGLLKALGIPVYDSDREAKRLMNEEPDLKRGIVRLLGEDAYRGGALHRAFIAEKVFSDSVLLESLNALVHPVVRQDFLRWETVQTTRVVVQESALIFENDMASQYHRIILVTAPLTLRVARVVLRDDSRPEEVMKRIRNQAPDRQKLPCADYWVSNVLRSETERHVGRLSLHLRSLQLQ